MNAELTMTDLEALEILRRSPKDFAKSLVSQHDARKSLSPRQWPWVHTLAREQLERERAEVRQAEWESRNVEAVVTDDGQMAGVVALLRGAGEQLVSPKVRLLVGGRHYLLSLAGKASKHEGCVFVRHRSAGGSDHVGRVTPDGLLLPNYGVELDAHHPGLVEMLIRLSVSPADTAREYGRMTGQCCFCSLPLTDPRSTAAGYGPVCAVKWKLPWG